MNSITLAIQYIVYNKLKTLILVGCVFLTALLPITVKVLLNQFNQRTLLRAEQTPVVIGAPGSRLDLTLHALSFQDRAPGTVAYLEFQKLNNDHSLQAIPICSDASARGYPVVGTSVDYLAFRKLKIREGSPFTMLGECVLGAGVAGELGIGTGDSILTDRENLVDIAGRYPLKLTVSGILAPSASADDSALFVDLKTSWVIQGLGHGHQNLEREQDGGKILKRTENEIIATDAVLPYLEITPENMNSFHFHGEQEEFPLTAIILAPESEKAATILEGELEQNSAVLQCVRPVEVVTELIEMLFRIKAFFDANVILITVSTGLLLSLVVGLSIRLRKGEMATMFKLGCSRGMMLKMQIWELLLIFGAALVLVLVTTAILLNVGNGLIERLFFY